MDYNQQRRPRQSCGCRQQMGGRCYDAGNSCQRPSCPMPRAQTPACHSGTTPDGGPSCKPQPPIPCPGDLARKPEEPCRCRKEPEESKNHPFGDYALSMAYIRWQNWGMVYDKCEALEKGTLFPVLNKPFCVRRCGS